MKPNLTNYKFCSRAKGEIHAYKAQVSFTPNQLFQEGIQRQEKEDLLKEVQQSVLQSCSYQEVRSRLVQFSYSVVSDSLRPHESQHARPPCPSPTPGVHPNSCALVMPSSHLILCHPFLFLPPVPPSIRVFSSESTLRIRWPKYWSFSLSISPPMNSQDWSPLGWTGWISLQSKGLSRVFSNTTVQKHQLFSIQISVCFNIL